MCGDYCVATTAVSGKSVVGGGGDVRCEWGGRLGFHEFVRHAQLQKKKNRKKRTHERCAKISVFVVDGKSLP